MGITATPSWSVPYSRDDRWLLRFLPSLTDLALLVPAFLLLALLPDGIRGLLGDADTGWHIRTGEWILQHRAVPFTDLFSFTKSGQPWFAWEWGWDVAFALIHRAAGLGGVLFVNVAILSLCSGLLFRLVRRACDHELIALLVTMLAMCASMIHWLARPHLLSWLFFILLLHILTRAHDGDLEALRWTPLLLIVWANVHGSFFLGVVMIFISALGQSAKSLLAGRPDLRTAWHWSAPFWFYGALSGLVTLVNPYTWHEHAHIISYLQSSALMDQIQEFQSPSFHSGFMHFYEAMLLLGVASVVCSWRSQRYAFALGTLLWAHFSLVASRNIPLFAFVAAPAIAHMFAVFNPASSSVLRKPVQLFWQAARFVRPFELVERWHLLSVLVFAYIGLGISANRPGSEADFPKAFPHAALASVERMHPTRIFTTDQWGDFFIYHFSPRTKVYFDGRSDFYGADFVNRFQHTLNGRWGWAADLDRSHVDMVVLAPDIPLAALLKTASAWRTLLDDGDVIVFVRNTPTPTPALNVAKRPIRISSVTHNGRRELGAVSACKYRTTTYERRC